MQPPATEAACRAEWIMAEQGMSRNEADEEADGASDSAAGRSLAVIGPARAARPALAAPRADAGFIAQLLACRAAMPDYRARRRAEPGRAARSYRAASALA
jgi:hypothetical protein